MPDTEESQRPEQKNNVPTKENKLSSNWSLFIIGIGVGWLVGLSVSPVVSIVITSVTGAAAAIVAAMSGLENKSATPQNEVPKVTASVVHWNVNPWPLAILVGGLFFGTSAGNWARANDLFGKRVSAETPLTVAVLQAEVEPWVTQGMSQTLVVQRLFDLKYPPDGGASTLSAAAGANTGGADQPNPYRTGLYTFGTAAGQADCQQIALTPNDTLESLILGEQNADSSRQPGSQNEVLRELFLALESPERFRTVVRILCASAQ